LAGRQQDITSASHKGIISTLGAWVAEAGRVLKSCRIGRRPIFVVGTLQDGITVLSQQIRALNLAWALVEGRMIDCIPRPSTHGKRKKVAVVGGGFSGLTIVAGLIEKGADVEITIFEERDTLVATGKRFSLASSSDLQLAR
jgi:hypothetical protein